MTQVKEISRATLSKVIRPRLDAMLKELSGELGVEITTASATYGGNVGSFKLDMVVRSEDGTVTTREREAFLELHSLYDLPKELLDSVLDFGSEKLRVSGLKPRASKNNIVLDCLDGSGRQKVAPAATVLAAYERQTAKKTA